MNPGGRGGGSQHTVLDASRDAITHKAGVPNSLSLMMITAISTNANVCRTRYKCCNEDRERILRLKAPGKDVTGFWNARLTVAWAWRALVQGVFVPGCVRWFRVYLSQVGIISRLWL